MKNIFWLVPIILLATGCAPSQSSIQTAVAQTQAAYTSTPEPTSTPAPTSTPTPTAKPVFSLKDQQVQNYVTAYLEETNNWSNGFERVKKANERIATEGETVLRDDAFVKELSSALYEFEQTAQRMYDLEPPFEQLQPFQDKADELHTHTEIFTSLYLLVLTGDPTAKDTAIDSLKKATETFSEIVNMLNDLMKDV